MVGAVAGTVLGGKAGIWTLEPGRSVYPRAEKDQQEESLHTEHLPVGRGFKAIQQ